jgi:lipid-A-disaccharide synthase-like uncharacterized protein
MNNFPDTIRNTPRWLLYMTGAGILVLYVYVGLTSFGYDDEYFNIRVVEENSLGDMISLVQASDLHPPLSYILNYIFYHATGSWNLVRMVSALLFAGSLIYYVSQIPDRSNRLLAMLLLGLNPTILLWTTGLRWYAYLLPILMVLTVLPDHRKWYYWSKFFLLMLLACFLGYVGFFLFVPYFLYYWLNDTDSATKKIKKISVPAFIAATAYAYQLYVFLTVHSKASLSESANQQVFDIKTSIVSWISSAASNQGLFPLSLWGFCSVAGSCILYLAALLSFKSINREKHWIVFLFSSVILILSGIAGKVRNLVLLEPSRNAMLLSLPGKTRIWIVAGFLLVLAGNGVGVYHVLAHRQTTKNAWNIPLHTTLDQLEAMEMPGRKEIYLTHSPTFTFYLVKSNRNPVSFYNGLYFDAARITKKLDDYAQDTATVKNLTFILTFSGRSIPDSVYSAMLGSIQRVEADSVKHIYLGRDPDYASKRKFFPGYPEYTVEIIKYYGVKKMEPGLKIWETGR